MGKRLYSKKREIVRVLLRQTRTEAGLTQKELATKLKRHQSFVSDYERGHRRLDWVAVEEVLTACGITVVQFAGLYQRAIAAL